MKNMDTNNTEKESFILIKFQGENDARPQLYFNNVNAFQIMGAASALEVHGKNFFIQQENEIADRRRQMELSVPKPEILVSGR